MILLWQWWEAPIVIPGGRSRNRREEPALLQPPPWDGEDEDFEVVAVLTQWLDREQ